ncbi:MAG: hypothetical protein KME42_16775 [Tildeniella nuda ZEHNDER 1965/U140]|nr:hypothetical protein [Tildeniella nuda ZEHNDER 1965/U140]
MNIKASPLTHSPTFTALTVDIPPSPTPQWNPLDPAWIKVWEQVGPIGYLALLCVLVWLLTRFVETVKGK